MLEGTLGCAFSKSQMKNQSNIRITIFSLWIVFWILSSILLLVAPKIQKEIDANDILPAIGSVASIWLPILSCFAAFWFNQNERSKAKTTELTGEQVFGALALSCGYLFFVFIVIWWATYGVNYGAPIYRTTGSLPRDLSFTGQIERAVRLSLWISPLATAPVVALTGVTRLKVARQPGQRRTANSETNDAKDASAS
jgi:hypothetical protein